MSIEAMKQALEALHHAVPKDTKQAREQFDAVQALRTAIQQAESEPVAWVSKTGHGTYFRESITPELASLEHGGRKMWRPLTYADTHPAPGVPDDGWVSVDERIPRIDGETNYIGVNSAGFMCVFNALMGTKCPNSERVFWHCDMETAEESIRMMSGLAYWRKAPSLAASPAQKGGE